MLESIPIANLTSSTLLGLAVLMVLLGRLVPRATLQDKVEESQRWRQAYEAERKARETSDAQTAELLETAKTTHTLITAMFENSKSIGGSHVSPPT